MRDKLPKKNPSKSIADLFTVMTTGRITVHAILVTPKRVVRMAVLAILAAALLLVIPPTGQKASADPSPLGQPYAVTLVVSDLAAAKSALSQGAGVDWMAQTQLQLNTEFNGDPNTKQKVTLDRVFSKADQPFIELVKATPEAGHTLAGTPWEPNISSTDYFAVGYLTYLVDGVNRAGTHLREAADMKLIAESRANFEIYEGHNGVRVQVIRDDLAPARGTSSTPQAPIDLGSVNHGGWHVDAESSHGPVRNQLHDALGVNWGDIQNFNQTPLNFWDEVAQEPVTEIVDVAISTTTTGGPFIEVASINPPLFPFNGTATFSPIHIAFAVGDANGDIGEARKQLETAGCQWEGGAEISGLEVVAHFSCPGGMDVEILSPLVAPQP
jgi:hypothetical protein